MTTTDPTEVPQSVTTLDNFDESPTTSLYRAAIGSINNDYYLPIFMRFEAADKASASWNWAACLYTLNWMIFRRLWAPACIYLATMSGAILLIFVFGMSLFQISETTEMSLFVALGILSLVIPGFYGNALFHAAIRKKMGRALSASRTMQEATTLLNQQAGTRKYFAWLSLVNLVLASAAVGAYLLPHHDAKLKVKDLVSTQPNEKSTHIAALPQPSPPASGVVADLTEKTNTTITKSNEAPIELQITPPVDTSDRVPSSSNFVPRRPIVLAAMAPTASSSETLPASLPTLVKITQPLPTSTSETVESRLKKPASKNQTGNISPYFVNVGLFAKEQNANNAYLKLSTAGLVAEKLELKTKKGQRTRVRVGPFQTQAEADVASEKIRLLNLDAIIIQQ